MKGYSEGMSARLLFALLTSGSHDCLALDEGFGAGDARFFERAQQRMETFIEAAGTLILASHTDDLLRQFCRRGIVFSRGEIIFDGPLEASLAFYHEHCC
jgi:lipopolysaccharide transport system ATP-binding protein